CGPYAVLIPGGHPRPLCKNTIPRVGERAMSGIVPIEFVFSPERFPPQFKLTQYQGLTKKQKRNYVLRSFKEDKMFRAVVEEAAALTSITLFLGMIAIWAQVLAAL